MSKTEQSRALSYLELFKITDQKYIIGVYEGGQTFYKQQIRALNIFDALKKTGKIPENKNFRIAIIGGGIAGLTFAAAALKSKVKVSLFEKGTRTLHIQAGCTIRDIHPNIYDWPSENCGEKDTSLPVLDWTFGKAADVVESITAEFKKIVTSAQKISPDCYVEHLNVQNLEVSDLETEKKLVIDGQITNHKKSANIGVIADLVIYAIGYGLEKGVSDHDFFTESYWRDTSIKQENLIKFNYLISGTGDGALIDLFTLLIRGFSYEKFLEIVNSNPKSTALMKSLVKIRNKRLSGNAKDNLYMTEFYDIPSAQYEYIIEALEEQDLFSKMGSSVNVYLFGHNKKFNDILNYKTISLLNAFITFILYRSAKFLYGPKLNKANPEYDGKPILQPYRIHIREGTDTASVIMSAKFNDDESKQLQRIKELQEKSVEHGIVNTNWNQDIFDRYFNEIKRPSHSLSRNTKAICSVFTNALGSALADFHLSKKDIRISIHRVLNMNGSFFYQMITPYFQSEAVPIELHKVGNIYQLERGNVGYSFRTGIPLWVKNNDNKVFRSMMDELGITKSYAGKRMPKTILTIPILAKFKKNGSTVKKSYSACNAVVYLDSTDIDFFDDKALQNLIIRLIQNFADSINYMVDKEDIKMGLLDFAPPQSKRINEIVNECVIELGDFSNLVPGEKSSHPIEFEQFYSLEM